MAEVGVTRPAKVTPGHQNLTPNERAVIERIRMPLLRSLVTAIWRVKLRLQFSGWLQYMLPALTTLVFALIALIVLLLGGVVAAIPVAGVGALVFLALCFELLTVKFRFRPREHRPHRNDNLGTFDLMRARRSCRSFQTRKMTADDHEELMGYVRVHSEEGKIGTSPVRFEYVSAPLTVWPTVNASEFLVAITPKQYDRLSVIDVGRSLQKIVMEATRMGLGTCWIGPGADHESIMHHLGDRFDPERDHIICVCAVGYKSRFVPIFIRIFNAQFHRRRPLSSLFFLDKPMTKPVDVEAYPFNRFKRNYEICQWAPSSYNGQTTRCVAVTKADNDGPMRFDFYAFIESRYYAPVAVGIWCANWELGCEALGLAGHFSVLSARERGIQTSNDLPQVPKYDVSWVVA